MIGKYNKLKNEILKGEFELARKTMKSIPQREFEQFMMGQPYEDEKEIVFYFFLVDLIGEKEEVKYHMLASSIMAYRLNWMPGAYNVSMRHVQRAMKLEPDAIIHKKRMLLYYEIPERLISDENALCYAKKVHEVDPTYSTANHIINKYNG